MSTNTNQKQNHTGSMNAETPQDNTFAMFVVAGMVASAAGVSAYTRHAGPLLRQMNKVSAMQGVKPRASSSSIKKNAVSKEAQAAADKQAKEGKDDII